LGWGSECGGPHTVTEDVQGNKLDYTSDAFNVVSGPTNDDGRRKKRRSGKTRNVPKMNTARDVQTSETGS